MEAIMTIIAPFVGIVASFALQIFKKYKLDLNGSTVNYIMLGLSLAMGAVGVWVTGQWNTADFFITGALVWAAAQAIYTVLVKHIIKPS